MNTIILDKVNDVSAFASNEPNRPVINNVCLGKDYVEATDGTMLVRAPYPDATFANDTMLMLPSADLRQAIAGLKKSKTNLWVTPVNDGNLAQLSDGKVARTTIPYNRPGTEAKWPNTDQVWPGGEAKFTVTIRADKLLTLAKYVQGITECGGGSGGITFEFRDNEGAIVWHANAGYYANRKVTGLLMPMRQ